MDSGSGSHGAGWRRLTGGGTQEESRERPTGRDPEGQVGLRPWRSGTGQRRERPVSVRDCERRVAAGTERRRWPAAQRGRVGGWGGSRWPCTLPEEGLARALGPEAQRQDVGGRGERLVAVGREPQELA